MAIKEKRVELRIEEDVQRLIQRAAASTGEPASEFIRKAAIARAEQVLAQEVTTTMSAAQFEQLLSSLDAADAATELTAVARRRRTFVRR